MLAWAIAVVAGFLVLWSYASTPGAANSPPQTLPSDSSLSRTEGRWTLVIFVHPRCPCTQSSLSELERLHARCAGQIDVRIACLSPLTAKTEWTETSLVRRAKALPSVAVISDTAGDNARLFHVHTSGAALLYDPTGKLAYHGGLTSARGHEGDNPGSDAVLALVTGTGAPATAPTFGCPLFSHQALNRRPSP